MIPVLNLQRLTALAEAIVTEWLNPKADRPGLLMAWRSMWWLHNYLRGGETWLDGFRDSDLWDTCPEEARFEIIRKDE